MRITNEKIYNYPMFANGYSDYIDNQFSGEFILDKIDVFYTASAKANITNPFIIEHLQNGNLGLFLHVECSRTSFRKLYPVPVENMELQVEIPSENLYGTVDLMLMIIALKNFKVKGNQFFDAFYQNEEIDFPQYAYVGYTSTEEYLANKEDALSSGNSIVRYSKDDNLKRQIVDYSSDYIIIYLPTKEYEKLVQLNGKLIRAKQKAFVEPAMVMALQALRENFEEYKEKVWCQALLTACSNLGYTNEDILSESIETTYIVLDIFKNSTSDALNELTVLCNGG